MTNMDEKPIYTISGNKIYLSKLSETKLGLHDLVWAISGINRFQGHGCFDYSVAQHCVQLAEIGYETYLPEEYRLALLLHDLHESLTNDLIVPVKAANPVFNQWEKSVMDEVIRQFWPSNAEPYSNFALTVHDLDKAIGQAELRALFPQHNFPELDNFFLRISPMRIVPRERGLVVSQYITTYFNLVKKIRNRGK